MAKKISLVKSTEAKKTFNYQHGETTLAFTLRIDQSSQLKAFKACLEEALKDVDEQLKGMKN